MNIAVNFFFLKDQKWKPAFNALRKMVLSCALTEELKWGVPCYTFQNSNIVLIHGFKAYCALLFHKGVLLKDPNGILIQQTENVQSARQIRFTSLEEINQSEAIIKAYILAAIQLEKLGLKVVLKEPTEFKIAEELQIKFEEFPELKKAFSALSPGRKRAYLLYFSAPKQAKTRITRVEKCIPAILKGKGLND